MRHTSRSATIRHVLYITAPSQHSPSSDGLLRTGWLWPTRTALLALFCQIYLDHRSKHSLAFSISSFGSRWLLLQHHAGGSYAELVTVIQNNTLLGAEETPAEPLLRGRCAGASMLRPTLWVQTGRGLRSSNLRLKFIRFSV